MAAAYDTNGVAAAPATPITASERIEVVDILRGFAIFGILTVNMFWFSNPLLLDFTKLQPWPGTADRVAQWLIHLLCQGKFYSLFSFLFGFGMAIQMARAGARGAQFAPLYARRLLVLLAIGLCHATFLWAGDILVGYALVGFMLLLFRRRSNTTLIVWGIIGVLTLVFVVAGLIGLGRLLDEGATPTSAPASASSTSNPTANTGEVSGLEEWVAQEYEVYGHGTYGQILRQRLKDYAFMLAIMLFFVFPSVLGMFLFGLYAGRRGFLHNPDAHAGFIRGVFVGGLILGGGISLVGTITTESVQIGDLSWFQLIPMTCHALGAPALCFCYASGIVLLTRSAAWRRRLRPLASVGRMALTNYLLQSLICTTIFNAYGLGLYARVGPALGLGLTCAIFAAQIPLSVWWLRRFRFGPMEW
ncbi:MAG: DUF418 domain-containing protein, partial [Planctomycetes bacterium]|nr:DUF418 domain-containing protein [Planctomycetota bacterium]